jgi:hypothetical protein
VLAELLKGPSECDKQIKLIAHPRLRRLLTDRADDAAAQFVGWLQQTVRAGRRTSRMSNHPADAARARLLDRFASADVKSFLPPSPTETIPWIMGVKLLNAGTGESRAVNVVRRLPNNPVGQIYKSEAMIKRLYVGYCQRDDGLDRKRPVLFAVSQTEQVSRQVGGRWVPLELPAEHVLLGRPLGADEPIQQFRQRWSVAFDELVAAERLAKVFTLSQGCVIEKIDGSRFQLRNDRGTVDERRHVQGHSPRASDAVWGDEVMGSKVHCH